MGNVAQQRPLSLTLSGTIEGAVLLATENARKLRSNLTMRMSFDTRFVQILGKVYLEHMDAWRLFISPRARYDT